jgi:hypothetical protein
MRSKTIHKKHKQRVYNMKGCSSKSKRNSKSKRPMKGGCGDTCPMTNHSMIGGYVRRRISQKQRSSSRSSRSSRKSRNSNSEMKGGNIFTDVMRGVAYNGGVIQNALGGYRTPVNPSPYMDQFRSTFSKV